ncbi:flagellar motor switch protein FliM [Clostridia bacterium]|nr:flagellar motor switch protein FliM [Clostridia bacterium]
MSEILSQSEIDLLLDGLTKGELDAEELGKKDEQQVKDYDFARPSKFSREHLRMLEIIFEHYGRLISSNLPVYLRKNIQVEVISSEALTYLEFSNSLANPIIMGVVNFAPIKGNILLELASDMGYAMVDRMLGGVGRHLDRSREFSEIEILILERIMNTCTELLREPWENVIELFPRLERVETSAQFAQFISPNEMVALITLNITMGEEEGRMNICLPYITLAEVMDRLNTKFWYTSISNQDDEQYHEVIEHLLIKAPMPVKAVLGKSVISVIDFVNLQPGDIIRVDTKVEDELDVYVGNIRKFTALPGASGENYAVRITSVIREEQ